jgi:hypothetical protein
MNVKDRRVDLGCINQIQRIVDLRNRPYDNGAECEELAASFISKEVLVFNDENALACVIF